MKKDWAWDLLYMEIKALLWVLDLHVQGLRTAGYLEASLAYTATYGAGVFGLLYAGVLGFLTI